MHDGCFPSLQLILQKKQLNLNASHRIQCSVKACLVMRKQRHVLGVVVIPPIRRNSYLQQLYKPLVDKIRIYGLWLKQSWKLIFYRKSANVVHIHWIEHLYRYYRHQRLHPLYLFFVVATPFVLVISKYVLRYRIVATLHNVQPHEPIAADRAMFRIVLSLCDRVIVHARFSARLALKVYGKQLESKIVVIPHGNFVSCYPNEVTKDVARRALGLRKRDFVLLFFGNIRPYKGVDVLLEAFRLVSKKKKNMVLVVAGRLRMDAYGKLIRSTAEKLDNCLFRSGFVPDDEVQLFLNSADVGVLPYRRITTPGSAFLFMSFGKPLIAPNFSVIREVCSSDFCFFFKPNDVKSLCDAIMKAYRNRDMVDEMGGHARLRAERYNWDSISQKHLLLYQTLCE